MDALHLLECLERTGSRGPKMEAAQKWLQGRNKPTGAELLEAMERQRAWPEGTVQKARFLLSGGDINELMGSPPPQSKEASETRMARALGETIAQFVGKHEDSQQDAQEQGIGNHEKMKARRGRPSKDRALPSLGGTIDVTEAAGAPSP